MDYIVIFKSLVGTDIIKHYKTETEAIEEAQKSGIAVYKLIAKCVTNIERVKE